MERLIDIFGKSCMNYGTQLMLPNPTWGCLRVSALPRHVAHPYGQGSRWRWSAGVQSTGLEASLLTFAISSTVKTYTFASPCLRVDSSVGASPRAGFRIPPRIPSGAGTPLPVRGPKPALLCRRRQAPSPLQEFRLAFPFPPAGDFLMV